MKALTTEEKKSRLEEIKKVSKDSKSFKEVAGKIGISLSGLKKFLKNFPKEEEKIKSVLSQNRKPKRNEPKKKERVSVEEKLLKIKKASQVSKNYKEITEITGLSYWVIKQTLDRKEFEDVKKEVQLNLDRNNNNEKDDEKSEKPAVKVYVIHTSITTVPNILEKLSDLSKKSRFLLTDIVLDEFKEQKKSSEFRLSNAVKEFYSIIEENFEFFDYMEVKGEKDNLCTNNEFLINMCREKSFCLLTASNDMYIRAQLSGVEVMFLSEKEAGRYKFFTGEKAARSEKKQASIAKEEKVQKVDTKQELKKHVIKKQNLIEISEIEVGEGCLIYTRKPNCVAEVWSRDYTQKREITENPEKLYVGEKLFIAELDKKCNSIIISKYEIQRLDSNVLFRTFRRVFIESDYTFDMNDGKIKKFVEKAKEILI